MVAVTEHGPKTGQVDVINIAAQKGKKLLNSTEGLKRGSLQDKLSQSVINPWNPECTVPSSLGS